MEKTVQTILVTTIKLHLIPENKNCPLVENNIFSVVDYGTADGANFFNILQDIKGNSNFYTVDSEIKLRVNLSIG